MLKDVLARIDKRLRVVRMSESAAAKAAGLSDSAIRNIRRAVKDGREQGASTMTLEKLAPILKTSAAWLLTGVGPETPDQSSIDRMLAEIPPEFSDEADELRDEFKRRIATTRRLIDVRRNQ